MRAAGAAVSGTGRGVERWARAGSRDGLCSAGSRTRRAAGSVVAPTRRSQRAWDRFGSGLPFALLLHWMDVSRSASVVV